MPAIWCIILIWIPVGHKYTDLKGYVHDILEFELLTLGFRGIMSIKSIMIIKIMSIIL